MIKKLLSVTLKAQAKRKQCIKLRPGNQKYKIVNSCNGLLCLPDPTRNIPLVVCNPVTSEFVNLPETQIQMKMILKAVWLGYGRVIIFLDKVMIWLVIWVLFWIFDNLFETSWLFQEEKETVYVNALLSTYRPVYFFAMLFSISPSYILIFLQAIPVE